MSTSETHSDSIDPHRVATGHGNHGNHRISMEQFLVMKKVINAVFFIGKSWRSHESLRKFFDIFLLVVSRICSGKSFS